MERLKQLRSELKKTQLEMAQMLGIDRSTYVKYERGSSEPPNATLCRLADFFNVSVDELLGRNTVVVTTPPPADILTEIESRLLSAFSSLNEEGQAKVFAYIEDLQRAGIYKRDHSAGVVSKQA